MMESDDKQHCFPRAARDPSKVALQGNRTVYPSRKLIRLTAPVFGAIIVALLLPLIGNAASAQERLSAFNAGLWLRKIPPEIHQPRSLRIGVLPGTDVVVSGIGTLGNGRMAGFAIHYFSGLFQTWPAAAPHPDWMNNVRNASPFGGQGGWDDQVLLSKGVRLSFHYIQNSNSVSRERTSSGFRLEYDVDIPDDCKDPASNWIETGDQKTHREAVLFYLFDPPAAPPAPGSCRPVYDTENPYQPPYDRIRLIDPLLTGVLLEDGSFLVASNVDNSVDMPVILRLRPDLTSPAIDNRSLFLVSKMKVDRIRASAMQEFTLRKQRGEFRDVSNEFAPFAALVEKRLLEFLKNRGKEQPVRPPG